ncbi:MAG: hypothetical protein L0K86_25570, partial [Actinomycetia bacterium]|nr:hypothetical protein [Actinomycetes bacterium]
RTHRGGDTIHVDAVPRRVAGGRGQDDIIASGIGRSDRQAANPLVINLRQRRMHRAGTTAKVSGFEHITGAESVPNTVVGTDTRERVVGGCRADTIRTRGGQDSAFPNAGNDDVRMARGNDRIDETAMSAQCRGAADDDLFDAGPGTDRLRLDRWGSSASDVVVNLTAGTSNSSGTDELVGLENVLGGNHDAEKIIGDDGPNDLDGGRSSGDDVHGMGSDDVLRARGATGSADGGDGTDTCQAATTVNCER